MQSQTHQAIPTDPNMVHSHQYYPATSLSSFHTQNPKYAQEPLPEQRQGLSRIAEHTRSQKSNEVSVASLDKTSLVSGHPAAEQNARPPYVVASREDLMAYTHGRSVEQLPQMPRSRTPTNCSPLRQSPPRQPNVVRQGPPPNYSSIVGQTTTVNGLQQSLTELEQLNFDRLKVQNGPSSQSSYRLMEQSQLKSATQLPDPAQEANCRINPYNMPLQTQPAQRFYPRPAQYDITPGGYVPAPEDEYASAQLHRQQPQVQMLPHQSRAPALAQMYGEPAIVANHLQSEQTGHAPQVDTTAWRSGGQSTFVNELKRELNLRSDMARRQAPQEDFDRGMYTSLVHEPRQAFSQHEQQSQAHALSDSGPARCANLKFRTFEQYKEAIERSRSRSRSPLPSQGLPSEAQDLNLGRIIYQEPAEPLMATMSRAPLSQQVTLDVSARQVPSTALLDAKSKLAEAVELQGYYQKMAEDYRSKFLALERDFNLMKHTSGFDFEKLAFEKAKTEDSLKERLAFEQQEAKRRFESAIGERDQQIENLIGDNRLLQQRLKDDQTVQEQLRDQIIQLKQENSNILDQMAALRREKDAEVVTFMQKHRQEKDEQSEKAEKDREKTEDKMRTLQLKHEKEQEQLRAKTTLKRLQLEKQLEDTQERMTKENKVLKQKVELLEGKCETGDHQMSAKSSDLDRLQKEFNELSKVNLEAVNELKQLRNLRKDFMSEREDLLSDLQGHQVEIENVYKINRELKAKIKRLESLLYGKNINSRK